MSQQQQMPLIVIWLLALLYGISLGAFLSAGIIYIIFDWIPPCHRLGVVGLIAIFAALILALPCGSSDNEEDEPETSTIVPEKGTPEA